MGAHRAMHTTIKGGCNKVFKVVHTIELHRKFVRNNKDYYVYRINGVLIEHRSKLECIEAYERMFL